MKITELRKKPKLELQRMCSDLQEKSRKLRFDLSSGKVKNIREIRGFKKDIARILTVLREAENGKQEAKKV